MRQIIEYKAWDKKTKQMFDVMNLQLNDIRGYVTACDCTFSKVVGVPVFIIEYTNSKYLYSKDQGKYRNIRNLKFLRYTGFKDKNGVKIFEGDIVECNNLGYKEGSPEYDAKILLRVHWGLYTVHEYGLSTKCWLLGSDYTLYDSASFTTVIGNIYQNPELELLEYPNASKQISLNI